MDMSAKRRAWAKACFVFAATFLASGCANLRSAIVGIGPKNWGHEVGHVWCNERYLDLVDDYGVGKAHRLSRRGYPYVLASALVLQKDDAVGRAHWFETPPGTLERVQDATLQSDENDSTGFFAATFLRPARGGQPRVVIVAFRGTDSSRDWFRHNLALDPAQFEPARAYVKRVAEKYPDDRLVVAGHSLGGGLAIHVTRHEDTSALVDEAWAIDTSPRIGGVPTDPRDPRIYFIASDRDGLKGVRPEGWLGAPEANSSTDYGLIRASTFYTHSRWVITREVLHFADYAIHMQPDAYTTEPTEPLLILKASSFKGCKPPYPARLEERRASKEPAQPSAVDAIGPRPN